MRSEALVRAGALTPVALFGTALTWLIASKTGFVTTDTYTVLDGVPAIDHCLRAAVATTCGGVGRYPLFQYVPALAVKRLGGSYEDGLRVLVALNGLALAGVVALAWRLGRALGTRYLGPALVICLGASPLLWYGNSGYGEGLAAALIAAYTYALITRRSPLAIGATLVLAGITKETAIVFLIAIAVVVEAGRRYRGESGFTRPQLAGLASGGALAVALNLGFNLFRYGTLSNAEYTRHGYYMPLHLIPEYFVGLLLSPTAGLVFMSPLVLVLLGVALQQARRRGRKPWREPAVAIALLLAALVASFAAWHSPFGGSAWGPRLLIPWLPAVAMLVAAFYASELDTIVEHMARSRRTVAAAAVLVALAGLPHLAVTVDSTHHTHPYPGTMAALNEVAVAPYFPDRECPHYPATPGNAYYLHCLGHWTWGQGLAIADAYRALPRRDAPLFAILYIAALAGAGALLIQSRPTRARAGT